MTSFATIYPPKAAVGTAKVDFSDKCYLQNVGQIKIAIATQDRGDLRGRNEK